MAKKNINDLYAQLGCIVSAFLQRDDCPPVIELRYDMTINDKPAHGSFVAYLSADPTPESRQVSGRQFDKIN